MAASTWAESGRMVAVLQKPLRNAAVLLAIVWCCSACAVGPNFASPSPPDIDRFTPEKLVRIGGSKPPGEKTDLQVLSNTYELPTRWWEAFGNINLNRLVQGSIDHNPSLQAAEGAIKVAYFNAEAQKGAFLPTIIANSNDSYNLQSNNQSLASIAQAQNEANLAQALGLNTNANVPTPNKPYTLFLKQLTISYVPDVWGQNFRAVESLEAQTDQQRYQLEAAYLSLTANVVTAAIQEASLRGQIEAIRNVISIERELRGLLQEQFRKGSVSEADVLTQEAALAQALALLPPLEKQLAVQRDLLTALAGRYSSAEISEHFRLEQLRLPRKLPITIPSRFVRQRPDIRAAEANMRSASAQIGVAIAARLPNISLTANGGSSAFKLAQLFHPGTGFYTLAASVTQPVFEGFTLLNKQKSAEAAFEQAEAQYRLTVITAFQNVADALRALQADAKAVSASRYAEETASKNLDIVRSQLRLGSVAVLALLNGQQTLLIARVSRVQAEASRLADTAALFMALGGGWADENLKLLPPVNDGISPTPDQVSSISPPVNPFILPKLPPP